MRRLVFVVLCVLLSCRAFAQTTELHSQPMDNDSKKGVVQYNVYVGYDYTFDFVTYSYYVDDHIYIPRSGPIVDFNVGARLNQHICIGGELSVYVPIHNKYHADLIFNIAPTVKAYIPCKNRIVEPFVNIAVGAQSAWGVEWGLYTHAGIGVDIKRFSLMAGYRGALAKYMSINMDKMNQGNSIYLQLGVRW